MKLWLIFSLWSAVFNGQCNLNQEKIPTGFLKNIYSSEALSGWIIKPDSSFYAITVTNGYLTEVGRGKVTGFKDSILSFQYDRDFQIPNRLNLNYYSDSRPNYDSIYINIQIALPAGKTFSQPPFVYYDDKLIGNTDDKGKFSARLHISQYTYPTSLAILGRSMGVPGIELFINPNLNHHFIQATIPGLDSSYCEVTGGSYDKNANPLVQTFKLCYAPCSIKSGFDRITFASKNEKEKIIAALVKAKSKQPHLSQIIDQVIYKFH